MLTTHTYRVAYPQNPESGIIATKIWDFNPKSGIHHGEHARFDYLQVLTIEHLHVSTIFNINC